MFWSFRNPLRIPGLVTKTVRRWSSDVEYSLLPSHQEAARRESESSGNGIGDKEKGDFEDGITARAGPAASARRTRTLVVLSFFCLCAGGTWFWTCRIPPIGIPDTVPEDIMIREVIYDDRDQTHIYLAPFHPLPPPRRLLTPSATTAPQADLSEYMSTGLFPPLEESPPSAAGIPPIDIVYLWVNSTDPFFPESFANRMEEEGLPVDRGQARRWRDNGELKGAVRSSVQSLGQGLRKVHIVSGDYALDEYQDEEQELSEPVESTSEIQSNETNAAQNSKRSIMVEMKETETEEGWTVGQIPEWLDWQASQSSDQDLVTWHFHSDIYRLPQDHTGEALVGREAMAGMVLLDEGGEVLVRNVSLEEEWRELALPTFNSFAIEARVGWITGLSENLYVHPSPW
jgi:hypothetical protein